MTELDDHQLLAEFSRNASETAFAALAGRHVNLVYSAALRFTGNPHHAEDVTQAVFAILARKAGGMSPRVVLSGWLYQAARLTAANFMKGEIRRRKREQEACMQSTLNEPGPTTWAHLEPLLDEAMGSLGETDRNTVVLRFFENKTARETGAALRMSEAAAHKRTARALDKLRAFFARRGVTLTAAAIAGAVSANSVQAAPAGMAAALTAVKGSGISASITTLVKGTLKTMTWLKMKYSMGIGLAVLLAAGGTAFILSRNRADSAFDPGAEKILNDMFAKYASLASYSDSGKSFEGGSTNTFTIKLGRPNLYRLEWDAVGEGSGMSGAAWSSGEGYFEYFTGSAWKNESGRYHQFKGLGEALEASGNLSGGAALTAPTIFYGKPISDEFGLLGLCSNFLRRDDQKIGGMDCYVLSGHLKAYRDIPILLWIGKNDLLIHEIQRTTLDPDGTVGAALNNDPEIKKLMEKWENAKTPEEKSAIEQQVEIAGARLEARTRRPVVHTEVHENIVVDAEFTKQDFAYPVSPGLKAVER